MNTHLTGFETERMAEKKKATVPVDEDCTDTVSADTPALVPEHDHDSSFHPMYVTTIAHVDVDTDHLPRRWPWIFVHPSGTITIEEE